MIEKENKEKIKYFVNGFSKVFDSKEEANHFASLKGVSRSQVSIVVPAELDLSEIYLTRGEKL